MIKLGNDEPTATEDLLCAYNWNKITSSALYPIIQCLEISLRNSIHNQACNHSNMSDWFDHVVRTGGDVKFTNQCEKDPSLDKRFYRKGISQGHRADRNRWKSNHENMIHTAKSKLGREGKAQTADAIVAELSFSFWVGMLEEAYWNDSANQKTLWPDLEAVVFPNMTIEQRKPKNLHPKLIHLKGLRNRLSHHEPIWKQQSVNNIKDAIAFLNNTVNDAINIIGGISADRLELLRQTKCIHRFMQICDEKCAKDIQLLIP